MNWTQTHPGEIGRLPVALCETQPLVVEGIKASLSVSRLFEVRDTVRSLEDAARVVITTSPRIMILDKALGGPAVLEWVTRMTEVCPSTFVVVWGASVTESEALRYLKMGAKGIVRKTAEISTILTCLEHVAQGSTWMEESLFREATRTERPNRLELTSREQQVLELVEQGLRNKEIARELGIRPGTVKIHLKHIFEKTGVRGRYGLALSGLRERATPQLMTA
ncbi:MAG TPA: response regulator transcription factor [Bryobacteraceae bacterium]|nr:response regulator transcription factor [Bryobacteraceae bacterium]